MPKGAWHEFDQPSLKRDVLTESILDKSEQTIRVKKTRVGKGGKTVTIISGLDLEADSLRTLLKKLKARCGTGGTFRANLLELQGDQVELVLKFLKNEGYSPKKAGG